MSRGRRGGEGVSLAAIEEKSTCWHWKRERFGSSPRRISRDAWISVGWVLGKKGKRRMAPSCSPVFFLVVFFFLSSHPLPTPV